jgi:hypothetical protein
MGRPKEYDRDAIALALIEWAKQPDSINLNKFCALNGLPPSYLTVWSKDSDNFSHAYEYAKTFIAFRREEMLTADQLHVKAYDLNATTYDYFLKEEKRKQAEFESNLRKQEEGAKQSTYIIQAANGLTAGANIPTAQVSGKGNTSPQ